ncbi:MAG: hypothetical protein KC912_16320 [Proteobacteria bacterium]|nr:hypothetical protein [Pseudomonadota bacterium]
MPCFSKDLAVLSLLSLLVVTPALALDEPCYGFAYTDAERLEGENFWVEWDPAIADVDDAQDRLDAAESARTTFIDMGWEFVDDPIAIRILPSDVGFSFGRTETIDCTDHPSPVIFLFTENERIPGESTTMHEVAHTVQYAYMGAYLDGVTSWIWWMEGCATWLTAYADNDVSGWARDASDYTEYPHLALHHRVAAFLIPEQSAHMYGTAILAQFIDEQYGGPDTVRATWEYGATVTGDVIWFPDALESAGVDFEAFWPHYMARLTTLDLVNGAMVAPVTRADTADAYPASGDANEDMLPEGLGMNFIALRSNFEKELALKVTFDGDPSVDWYAVLASSESTATGTPVLDYIPLEVDENGHAEGWISNFHLIEGHLIVSPKDPDNVGFEYSWSAELIEDPGPMPGVITLSERTPLGSGCGCVIGGFEPMGALFLVGVAAVRRRRD